MHYDSPPTERRTVMNAEEQAVIDHVANALAAAVLLATQREGDQAELRRAIDPAARALKRLQPTTWVR